MAKSRFIGGQLWGYEAERKPAIELSGQYVRTVGRDQALAVDPHGERRIPSCAPHAMRLRMDDDTYDAWLDGVDQLRIERTPAVECALGGGDHRRTVATHLQWLA